MKPTSILLLLLHMVLFSLCHPQVTQAATTEVDLQPQQIQVTTEMAEGVFPAMALSFVELESHTSRQNMDDEYDENDPASSHNRAQQQHHQHSPSHHQSSSPQDSAPEEEVEPGQGEFIEEVDGDNDDGNNNEHRHRHHHSSNHHHHSSSTTTNANPPHDNDRSPRFQETQQHLATNTQHQQHQEQLLGTDPATASSSAASGGESGGESGEFGPCKTCVFVLERIKKGTNMLLPAICSEIYIHFPNAYAMCHQVLNALSLNGNNVRYWLFEGCYKYEIYQAKEWVKPCPSHVMCTVLKTLKNTPFCHPLPMENPFIDDVAEGGEASQSAASSSAAPAAA